MEATKEIEASGEKKNLKELVIEGQVITWRDIKKAFVKIGFMPFLSDHLFCQLYMERINAEKCHSIYKGIRKAESIASYRNLPRRHLNQSCNDMLKAVDAIYADYLIIKDRLIEEELIAVPDEEFGCEITPKGHRLKCQSLTAPITRAKAENLLKQTVEAIEAINADPESPYTVVSLHVFGSYLSDKQMLGDIDLAFDSERNYLRGEQFGDYRRRERCFLKKHGRQTEYTFIKKMIKARQVSLCTLSDLKSLEEDYGTVSQCVFNID